jgi:hypothetical protein
MPAIILSKPRRRLPRVDEIARRTALSVRGLTKPLATSAKIVVSEISSTLGR